MEIGNWKLKELRKGRRFSTCGSQGGWTAAFRNWKLKIGNCKLEIEGPPEMSAVCDLRFARGVGRCLVMGVVNVTPDSFYDGGRFFDPEKAIAHGLKLASQGADILDIGGESSRPGADPVTTEEELRRILPVIRQLAREVAIPLSVDTYKAQVARKALEAGASLVNDISGLKFDPEMARTAAEVGASVVVMHTAGPPKTMQQATRYHDLMAEIIAYLRDSLRRAEEAGIAPEKLVVDPGIGFGKTTEQNLRILRELEQLQVLGRPILVGVSRKSFIGQILGESPEERLEGSLAAVAWAVIKGAKIIRTHDVLATRRMIRMLEALLAAREL